MGRRVYPPGVRYSDLSCGGETSPGLPAGSVQWAGVPGEMGMRVQHSHVRLAWEMGRAWTSGVKAGVPVDEGVCDTRSLRRIGLDTRVRVRKSAIGQPG